MTKTRKMLSDWDAPYIQSLVKLVETQSKSTLAHWAVDYAEQVLLPLWRKYFPDDLRPQNSLNAARDLVIWGNKIAPGQKNDPRVPRGCP